jgi:hypothetical protein
MAKKIKKILRLKLLEDFMNKKAALAWGFWGQLILEIFKSC